MVHNIKSRYIGDKKFYRSTFAIAVPIMVQNFITSFVNMLDNVMVGQIGTAQMSGVSIVNQLLFVMHLCLFGAVSGAGIFTAQFAGSKDHEGVRNTFRFKLMICTGIAAVSIAIFSIWGSPLITTFLKGEGSAEEAIQYLEYGNKYLRVMLVGLVPFAISNVYCSTLREQGETLVPMISGISAVFVNLILNYVFIFGHLGLPAMGVTGAALATVISRFSELAIVAVWTHTHRDRQPFAKGLYKKLTVPVDLTKRIIIKGTPLVINETMFSLGITMVNQSYSTRGLEVMAAINICSTLSNVMRVASMAMGNAVGIIMGQCLGANRPREEVMDTNKKLVSFSVMLSIVCVVITVLLSGLFPRIYNTSDSVRSLAASFILINAFIMPFSAYANAAYFTLRSGGKTLITMLFDCCFVWVVLVPLAVLLSRYTTLPVREIFLFCQSSEIIKCVIGFMLVKKGVWINNIIEA